MRSIRTLLYGIVDYAGLFPPANLDMARAAANYAEYLAGEDAWALGRFVLPVSRLAEFEAATDALLPRARDAAPWRLSALGGADVEADVRAIADFNRRHAAGEAAGAAVVDAIELKTPTVERIDEVARALPRALEVYCEIPVDPDPRALLAAVARAGARAKVRTGGVTPDAFPTSAELARFLHRCVEADVPFKATAGLHHPVRAAYPLTYEPGAPTGTMFGYLNVFLAAAFLRAGLSLAEATAVLEETSPDAFVFDDAGVAWRRHRLDLAQLEEARRRAATSFGSCSFREPIDDLAAITSHRSPGRL